LYYFPIFAALKKQLMATTHDVSVGSIIRFNGELCAILEFQHRTPGNLRAFYQAKMRNLKTGKLVENRFRSGEEVELARVEFKDLQYIYTEGDFIVCMDNETYEQVHVPVKLFGVGTKFLKEGMEVKVAFENDLPILAEPPNFVEMTVTDTASGERGNTATSATKSAIVENGAEIFVPMFVNNGDKVKIDTRTGTYCERVK
jgi:elongation factor P